MGWVFLSVAAALGVQFLCLPMLIGAKRGAEAIGWTMILGIFFGAPSAAIYFLLFSMLKVASLAPLLTILIGSLAPALLGAMLFWKTDRMKVFSRQNYVVRSLLAGGLSGSTVLSGVLGN